MLLLKFLSRPHIYQFFFPKEKTGSFLEGKFPSYFRENRMVGDIFFHLARKLGVIPIFPVAVITRMIWKIFWASGETQAKPKISDLLRGKGTNPNDTSKADFGWGVLRIPLQSTSILLIPKILCLSLMLQHPTKKTPRAPEIYWEKPNWYAGYIHLPGNLLGFVVEGDLLGIFTMGFINIKSHHLESIKRGWHHVNLWWSWGQMDW